MPGTTGMPTSCARESTGPWVCEDAAAGWAGSPRLAAAALVLLPAGPAPHGEPGPDQIAKTGGIWRGCHHDGLCTSGDSLIEPVVQQRCLGTGPAGCRHSGSPAENNPVVVG